MEKNIINILKNGGIGVMPTDTIYGLVGQALKAETVERIYQARQRQPEKPFIVLIADLADLGKFNIKLDQEMRQILNKLWPKQVSVILPCKDKKFEYLHRGLDLAVRLPDDDKLREIIRQAGPLVAPSANLEGQPLALTIKEAEKYFGAKVDFYQDVGRLESAPSTLVKLTNGQLEVLRQGAVDVSL